MQNIILSLSVAEADIILAALGNAPYATVAPIIDTIRQQAAPQLAPPQAPVAEAQPSAEADANPSSQNEDAAPVKPVVPPKRKRAVTVQ